MNRRELQLGDAARLPSVPVRLPVDGNGHGQPALDELASLGPSWRPYLQQLVGSQTPISVLLSHDAVSVGPGTSVEWLTEVLLERGLSAAPVIDERGALVGLVSTADLLREVQDREDVEERIPLRQADPQGVQVELGNGFHATCLARATVEEIMTRSKFTLPETASVARAASLMAFEGVSHLPVACSRCKGVCLVTALNVMGWLAQQSGFVMSPPIDPRREVRASIAEH